jgi:hypothetical protein
MEVEQSETVEVTPEISETDQLSEQDAAQINEWLDDKIGTDTEDVEVAEDTEEVATEPEPVELAQTEVAEVAETPRVSKAFSKVAKKEREVNQQRQELYRLKAELEPLRKAKERADKGDMLGA